MKEALDAKFHDHPGMLRVFPDRGREEEEEEKVIIIADPDDRIKHEISRRYVHENFTFIQAFSSDELLEWLRECSPDVLIVSTELPGIPTAKLVSIVKLIQPGIPVITVTDQHSIEFDTEIDLRREGIFYLFNKSFGFDELKAAITRAATAAR